MIYDECQEEHGPCDACGSANVHDDQGYMIFACPEHATLFECVDSKDHKQMMICTECERKALHYFAAHQVAMQKVKAYAEWWIMTQAKYAQAKAEGRDPSRV